MKRRPNSAGRFRQLLRHELVTRLKIGPWRCRFVNAPTAVEYSTASSLSISAEDWQRVWPRLVDAYRADSLDVLKRDASGDVTATTISLAGVPVDVVLKRPLEKYWYRKLTSVWRPSRALRAWQKARVVRVRNIAVEVPLAVFERRRAGVPVEAVAIFERVPGTTLEHVDLNLMNEVGRSDFFRRCGYVLRRLEKTGLAHTDAKSSNWIVFNSPTTGPRPVLIDVYGVRWLNPWLGLFGLHRLLRAMKKHPQYTPADSLAICQGFAPKADFKIDGEGHVDAN